MATMEATIATILDPRGHLLKEAASGVSPPPAYSPQPRRLSNAQVSAEEARYYHSSPRQPVMMGREPVTAIITGEDEADAEEGQSPISLRINTSVRISSNNNLVCCNTTPAENAKAIARAVVVALQENSSGQCGIPMIDEDGRPRPVRIEVDAGMEVQGIGNVIGNEKVINEVLRQRSELRRRRDDGEDTDRHDGPAKRRRTE
ncbi:uncharacterized protein MAM_02035 [Metarhizium album ARSEF 1941]|uniref:Uncharacterized protein n=1 Tax=Metarhizium album (strain ARSEF 1941) TaxID=1081103 RepID=A0A0B2WVG7_METAS|nr:uncharacterized protein MAM_02035 [Metarhizium album ARSEF 1941]KHO00112.1 hypothetical protein MAM_02035 [Metarhizium album ARSEF 1941]